MFKFLILSVFLISGLFVDGKRQRRGAISDVPSAFKALDLSLFPPKPPHVVAMLELRFPGMDMSAYKGW